MKLLVVGCGSIGRRHAKNAQKLGLEIVLCDTSDKRLLSLASEVKAVDTYSDYRIAASQSGANAALIATPSHLHVEHALAMIAADMHILMEKPLCSSLAEAYELQRHVNKSKRIFMMAHTFRFRDEWREIKKLIDKQPVGRVLSAELSGGWHLPDWHFREDYRKEYAANKNQGGGVMLTSMSHLLDIVSWCFGGIQHIVGAKMKLSDLQIDVDDSVMCVLKTKTDIAVSIYEDFLARCPRRMLRVNGEHGYIEADFNRKSLKLWDSREKRFLPDSEPGNDPEVLFRILEDGVGYDLNAAELALQYSGNDAYLAELKEFSALVESNTKDTDLGIEAGIEVLEAMESSGIIDWTEI